MKAKTTPVSTPDMSRPFYFALKRRSKITTKFTVAMNSEVASGVELAKAILPSAPAALKKWHSEQEAERTVRKEHLLNNFLEEWNRSIQEENRVTEAILDVAPICLRHRLKYDVIPKLFQCGRSTEEIHVKGSNIAKFEKDIAALNLAWKNLAEAKLFYSQKRKKGDADITYTFWVEFTLI